MTTKGFLKISSFKARRSLQAVMRLIAVLTILMPARVCFAQSLPRVALECPSDVQHPGEPFELRVLVSWEGDAESHVIVPPEPDVPQGMTVRSSSFETFVSDSHYQLTYRFILVARRAGRFTIYPVAVLCWPRGSSTEQSVLTNECIITVEPDLPLPQQKIMAIATAVMLAMIITFFFMIKKRLGRTRRPEQPAIETNQVLVQQCRRERLQGDYVAFYTTALRAAHALIPADKSLHSRIEESLERAQFSSQKPPAEDAEHILYQLERALKHTGQT